MIDAGGPRIAGWGFGMFAAGCLVGSAVAGAAGVDLRVVDEMAPPGGLAVFRVELTEPKPISRGRIRLAVAAPVLGSVIGAAMLNDQGNLQAENLSLNGEAVFRFTSADSSLGTSPELPILLVAVQVPSSALPGSTATIALDLPQSEFFDPAGNPYPEETKVGTFTVGGLSVNSMDPLQGSLPADSVIRIQGAGFDPQVDVNIQGASFSEVRVLSSSEIEVRLATSLQLLGTTRVRLRNPNGDEDFFYPAVLEMPSPPGNSPPLAQNDSATVPEDGTLLLQVLTNDSDPDGDPIELLSVTSPAHGTAVVTAPNQVEYEPIANFHGSDSFSYTIADTDGAQASAQVDVVVEPVNDPPLAAPDQFDVPSDTLQLLNPLGNDQDVDGDSLTVASLGSAEFGNAFLLSNGEIWYVPPPGFQGTDSFSYTLLDPSGAESTATVSLNVRVENQPPIAVADVLRVSPGGGTQIDLLTNDFDPNGDGLSTMLIDLPEQGQATLSPEGLLSYQAAPAFTGIEEFNYRLSDPDGASSIGRIIALVEPDVTPRFEQSHLELAQEAVVAAILKVPPAAPAGQASPQVMLSSTPPGVIDHPPAVEAGNSGQVVVPVQALLPGIAVLEARLDETVAHLVVVARSGRRAVVPVPADGPAVPAVGLALTNRSSVPVLVNVEGFGDSMEAASPQHQLQLSPANQRALLLSELSGFDNFAGWVSVSSVSPEVFPMFLSVQSPVKGLAGASRLAKQDTWVFPRALARDARGQLTLINGGISETEISLSTIETGPTQPLSTLSLRGLEATSWTLEDLGFPSMDLTGHLEVRAQQPIHAFLQLETDRALWAQAPRAQGKSSTLLVPHVVSGLGWSTELTLTDLAQSRRVVELSLITSSPTPGVLQAQVEVLAGATRAFTLEEVFGLPATELITGSLRLTGVRNLRSFATLGHLAGLKTAVPVLEQGSREALFAQAASGNFGGVNLFTGLAFMNPEPEDAVVAVDVYASDGTAVGQGRFVLAGDARLAKLLRELTGLAQGLSGGYVRVRSSTPLAVVEMFGDFAGTFLSTVDPAEVAAEAR